MGILAGLFFSAILHLSQCSLLRNCFTTKPAIYATTCSANVDNWQIDINDSESSKEFDKLYKTSKSLGSSRSRPELAKALIMLTEEAIFLAEETCKIEIWSSGRQLPDLPLLNSLCIRIFYMTLLN